MAAGLVVGGLGMASALADAGRPAGTGAGVEVSLPAPARGVGRHLAPAGEAAGAVIVVPATGGPLALTGSARALQLGLPRYGWHTLAVALPEIGSELEPWHRRVAAQIAGGVRYLAGLGIRRLVVAAHGAAAGGAAHYFRGGADPVVAGFVGISPVYPARPGADASADLTAAWPRQILEIYAELDHPVVMRLVNAHRRQVQALPEIGLRQIRLLGARHELAGYERIVLKRVRGWLVRSVEVTVPPAVR